MPTTCSSTCTAFKPTVSTPKAGPSPIATVDLVMESRGTVDGSGYSVEVSIPFASLRYHSRDAAMVGMHGIHSRRPARLRPCRHHGATGRVMLVNGAPWPFLEVANKKYRFRILNASNATAMRLALSTHHPWVQIASDQTCWRRPSSSRLALAMAERVEVVVDFSVYPLGTRVVLENRRGEGQLRSVMRFDVVRTARDDSRVPERLGDIEPLDWSQAARTRTFVFGGKPTLGVPPGVQWVINGEPFDPLRVDASPRLDDVEVWRFVNRPFVGRTMLHPVHTHLAPFQVLSRTGAPASRRGWKDTVAIDDGEEVEVVIRRRG